MNVDSFIVLTMLHYSLPTKPMLSTLVWCPLVLAWSKMRHWTLIFFKVSPKASCSFTNILLITLYFVTPKPINHSKFLYDVVSALGGNHNVFDRVTSPEVNLYSQFVANVFEKHVTIWYRVQPCQCFHPYVVVAGLLALVSVVVVVVVVLMVVFGIEHIYHTGKLGGACLGLIQHCSIAVIWHKMCYAPSGFYMVLSAHMSLPTAMVSA